MSEILGAYLNRHLLAQHLADQVDGLSLRMASATVQALIETMAETLAAGGEIRLTGLGTFSVRYRRSRQTYHPRTRQAITVPAAWVPRFSPSRQLREQVQKGGQERAEESLFPDPDADPQQLSD